MFLSSPNVPVTYVKQIHNLSTAFVPLLPFCLCPSPCLTTLHLCWPRNVNPSKTRFHSLMISLNTLLITIKVYITNTSLNVLRNTGKKSDNQFALCEKPFCLIRLNLTKKFQPHIFFNYPDNFLFQGL